MLGTNTMYWRALTAVMALMASVSAWASAPSSELPSPDKASSRLKAGNARFAAGKATHPRSGAARRKETADKGQHPFATVITCSDSRVPVELLFDQGVGDVFVIRVAGNVCDTDEVGSIEYGVDHLGTPIMVVLGHTHCGAVTAVVTKAKLHGSIPPLVDNIAPAVKAARKQHPKLHGKALVPEAVKANVWQSIDDLFKTSPATRKRVKAGTLKVVGAVYDIRTGKVQWLGKHPGQGRLLRYTSGPKGEHKSAPVGPGASSDHGNSHGAVTAHAAPQARHQKGEHISASIADPAGGMGAIWMVVLALAVVTILGGIAWKSGVLGRMGMAGKL